MRETGSETMLKHMDEDPEIINRHQDVKREHIDRESKNCGGPCGTILSADLSDERPEYHDEKGGVENLNRHV